MSLEHVYPLTPFGRDLCPLAEDAEPPPAFVEAIRDRLAGEGRTISLLKFGPLLPDGHQQVIAAKELTMPEDKQGG